MNREKPAGYSEDLAGQLNNLAHLENIQINAWIGLFDLLPTGSLSQIIMQPGSQPVANSLASFPLAFIYLASC